jgi:hypothetical protein
MQPRVVGMLVASAVGEGAIAASLLITRSSQFKPQPVATTVYVLVGVSPGPNRTRQQTHRPPRRRIAAPAARTRPRHGGPRSAPDESAPLREGGPAKPARGRRPAHADRRPERPAGSDGGRDARRRTVAHGDRAVESRRRVAARSHRPRDGRRDVALNALRLVQLVGELADALGDVVARSADLVKRSAFRVGELPVDVALAGDVGAGVAAASRSPPNNQN